MPSIDDVKVVRPPQEPGCNPEDIPPYIRTDRLPIHADLGYHEFVESEFADVSEAAVGRCDRCGGGPDAEIHQKPVDQLERIADALERWMNGFVFPTERSADALERIAVELGRLPIKIMVVCLAWMLIIGGLGVWIGVSLR